MSFDPNKITYFAKTDARGKNVTFGIKARDRQRHMYVIGKTGMGKSTMLENMAVQDIQNGEGMAFIDPHGTAAETLLNYVPEHRVNDVLYFAPFDTNHPVSFNIMEDVGVDRRHLVVSGLMSVFEKIWVDAWSARMAYILQNTLMALLEYPDSTLLGVNRMLSDKRYRDLVVANVKDPGVKAFWVDEFAKYNERYMQEAGDAIKNKIGQFTANPIIRNIIGQPKSSFDIRTIMDEKKILIMNLSKGLIGETNANLLGSMLTTRIYLAAMSRADLSPEKMKEMPNFYFYVDEFQSFANATFANILSEARKYHLNLTIAHQYIEQMEEEVRNAVFGNVGTIIAFRVGPFDAEVLETVFTPQFLATDLVNLGYTQIYLTLMIDGIGSQPFSATTLPPIAAPTISCKDMAVAASRRQFTHPRKEVEELIHKFHEPIIPERTSGNEQSRDRERVKVSVPEKSTVLGGLERRHTEKRVSSDGRKGQRPPSSEGQQTSESHAGEGAARPERRSDERHGGESRQQAKEASVDNQKNFGRPKEQNLNELRSILKHIVKTEIGSEDGTNSTAPKPSEKEQKFKESRGELKNLLANVLDTTESSHVDTPVVSASQPEEIQPSAGTTERSLPQAKDDSSLPHANQNHISAKDLERMMRVHANEKPPL